MVEEKTIGGNGSDYLLQQKDSVDMMPVLKSSISRHNGSYSIGKEEAKRILSGKYEITPGSEVLYVSRKSLEETLFPKYSIMHLKSYDAERHVEMGAAFELVDSQKDESLPPQFLRKAIEEGEIETYVFKGQEFLDRLDIGRIYHQIPKKKSGLKIERYFTKGGEDPFASVEFATRDIKIEEYENGKKTGKKKTMKPKPGEKN